MLEHKNSNSSFGRASRSFGGNPARRTLVSGLSLILFGCGGQVSDSGSRSETVNTTGSSDGLDAETDEVLTPSPRSAEASQAVPVDPGQPTPVDQAPAEVPGPVIPIDAPMISPPSTASECPVGARADNDTIIHRVARLFWGEDALADAESAIPTGFDQFDATNPNDLTEVIAAIESDERSSTGTTQIFLNWLGLEHAITHPELSEESITSGTIETVRWAIENNEPLAQLYAGDRAVINDQLADFYGVAPTGDWQLVQLPSPRDAGLLSHAHWLSNNNNPVRRGLRVQNDLLCVDIPEPPAGLDVSLPGSDSLTQREAYAMHAEQPTCNGCHRLIDPVGFAFGAFDGLGAVLPDSTPVDTSGEIAQHELPFDDLGGLVELLDGPLQSQVHACFVKHAVTFAFEQQLDLSEACWLEQAQRAHRQSEGRARDWLTAIAQSSVFVQAAER